MTAPRVDDVSFVAGRYTQVVVDAGTAGTRYHAIAIETARSKFFERVEVAVSDDRATWTTIRSDALIYDVEGALHNRVVTFVPANARWLRLRIFDPQAPFPVLDVQLTPAKREPTAHFRLLVAASIVLRTVSTTALLALCALRER